MSRNLVLYLRIGSSLKRGNLFPSSMFWNGVTKHRHTLFPKKKEGAEGELRGGISVKDAPPSEPNEAKAKWSHGTIVRHGVTGQRYRVSGSY